MHRFLPITALIIALVGCADPQRPAATQAATPPAAAPAAAPVIAKPFSQAASDIVADPAVRWGSLPSGLRYGLVHQAQPAGKVTLRLRIASGSLLERDEQRGLAHYLEHMAFNGTKRFPGGDLVKRLQAAGLAFGAHTNAHTSYDETVYKLDLPDTKPETLALALDVLADQAGGMLLLPDEVEKERGVILAEMRDRDGAGRRLWKRSAEIIYAGTIIAERSPIGVPETIAAATPALLRDYYDRWYTPDRMVLAVSGDIDPAALEPEIRNRMAVITARRPAQPDSTLGTLRPSAQLEPLVVADAEAEETDVRFGRVRERVPPADTSTSRRAQFLTDMAESILGRRIAKLIEAKADGPLQAGGAYSYQWLGYYHAGVQGTARAGKAAEALRVLVEEYRRMLEHGPTDGELATTIAALQANFDTAVERSASRSNASLADGIINALGDDQVFISPEQSRSLHRGFMESASPEEVRLAFNLAWGEGGRLVVTAMGRDPGADPASLAALADWSAPVAKPAEQQVVVWAYPTAASSAPADLPAAVDGIVRFAMGNVAVTVRPSKDQPGSVAMLMRLHARPFPRGPAVAELAARVFMAGGLGKHDLDQLRQLFAGSSASINGPRVEDDSVSFMVGCRPADFAEGCERLAAQLTDPGWRSEPAQRALAAWKEELAAAKTDLDQQVGIAFAQATTGGAAWRRPATLAEVGAVDLAQAKDWLMPIIGTAPMSITVVGDIEPATVQTALLRALSGVAANRPALPVTADETAARAALPPADPWTPGAVTVDVPGTVARDVVMVAWPTDDVFDIRKARRLQFLADGIADRLRERLREQLGQAYSPSCWRVAGDGWRGWGYLGIHASVAHGQAAATQAVITDLIADIKAKGIDADTFARIRAPAVKSVAALRKRNDWWLGTVLGRSAVQPFRPVWAAGIEADITAITRDEVNALAATLDDTRRVVVVGTCAGVPAAAPAP
jgi:zinc protease